MPLYTVIVTLSVEAPSRRNASEFARLAVENDHVSVLREFVHYVNAEADEAADCTSCDGYVLNLSEAPYCPTCARERREVKP